MERDFKDYNERVANNTSICSEDVKGIIDFETVKDRIYACIINYEKNVDIDAPYVKIGNLMICYRVLVKKDEKCIYSLLVMNELYNKWNVNISAEEFLKLAYKNTKRLFPPKYELERFCTMYRISNSAYDRGAVYMLDKKILSDISNELCADKLIILPSSINEVFVTKYCDEEFFEDMKESVKEINSTAVSEEEFLSDTPYIYDNINKEITYDDDSIAPYVVIS